jgi:hypothetical protein
MFNVSVALFYFRVHFIDIIGFTEVRELPVVGVVLSESARWCCNLLDDQHNTYVVCGLPFGSGTHHLHLHTNSTELGWCPSTALNMGRSGQM